MSSESASRPNMDRQCSVTHKYLLGMSYCHRPVSVEAAAKAIRASVSFSDSSARRRSSTRAASNMRGIEMAIRKIWSESTFSAED